MSRQTLAEPKVGDTFYIPVQIHSLHQSEFDPKIKLALVCLPAALEYRFPEASRPMAEFEVDVLREQAAEQERLREALRGVLLAHKYGADYEDCSCDWNEGGWVTWADWVAHVLAELDAALAAPPPANEPPAPGGGE